MNRLQNQAILLFWASLATAACATPTSEEPAEGSGGTGAGTTGGAGPGSAGTGGTTTGSGGGVGSGGLGSGGLGSVGSGGLVGTGGGAGTGGASGTGGAPAGPVACPTADTALLLDFTEGDAFGDFTTVFSGGVFAYGEGLTADATGAEWHISGDLAGYGGLGFYFNACHVVDASAFSGIQFTISGTTSMTDLIFEVGTASNLISTAWRQANGEPAAEVNAGTCQPAESEWDGTCATPSYTVTVPASPTVIQVAWTDLVGGAPSASVDPTAITSIGWRFADPEGVDTTPVPYAIDIVIDDIGFMP